MQKAKDWFKEHEHAAEVPPGYFPVGGSAALNPGGGRFDSMRLTVGDLVGWRLGTSQERSNPIQMCTHDSPCRTLHASLDVPCLGILCRFSGAPAATVNANGTGHFDSMQPTIGDFVGIKTVDSRIKEVSR